MIAISCCFIAQKVSAGVEGEWVRVSHGEIPEHAFLLENQSVICRAPQSKGVYPGYLIHESRACILNVAGRAVKAIFYEVLLGDNYQWQPFSRGYVETIPPNAVLGGTEDPHYDRALYICRAKMQQKEWVIGKLSNPLRGCQINHNNREHSSLDFEILISTSTTQMK
jgi:hypothetical protein